VPVIVKSPKLSFPKPDTSPQYIEKCLKSNWTFSEESCLYPYHL